MKKTNNGTHVLPDQLESMRQEVIELELKSRFWKAQVEIRKYSMEYEDLEPAYAEYTVRQQALAEELKQKKEEALKKLQEEFEKQAAIPTKGIVSDKLEKINE